MASESSGSTSESCEDATVSSTKWKFLHSSGKHCAVNGCFNNQRKRKLLLNTVCLEHGTLRERCRCGIYSLHRFPSEKSKADLRFLWISAVYGTDFDPGPYARVCSEHFVDGCPTGKNPVPVVHLGDVAKAGKKRRKITGQGPFKAMQITQPSLNGPDQIGGDQGNQAGTEVCRSPNRTAVSGPSGMLCAVMGCINSEPRCLPSPDQRCHWHDGPRSQCQCGIVHFYSFPLTTKRCREWMVALSRPNYIPRVDSHVCSLHFIDGKPTPSNPLPVLHLGHSVPVVHAPDDLNLQLPTLKSHTVGMQGANYAIDHPTQRSCGKLASKFDKALRAHVKKLKIVPFTIPDSIAPRDASVQTNGFEFIRLGSYKSVSTQEIFCSDAMCQTEVTSRDSATQWEVPSKDLHLEHAYANMDWLLGVC